jgi:hypothetical protein
MRTRLTDLLEIEHPVMLAGMGGVSYYELVAAVSEAGGFGCMGASTMNIDRMVEQMQSVRATTDKPFGVDLLTAAPGDMPAQVQAIIDNGGRVFVAGDEGGGHSSAEIFDPLRNEWTHVAPMPTHRWGCVARSLIVDGREFVVVFGCYQSSAVEAFDVAMGTWERLHDMPMERSYLCIWPMSENIALIGGGLDENHKPLLYHNMKYFMVSSICFLFLYQKNKMFSFSYTSTKHAFRILQNT